MDLVNGWAGPVNDVDHTFGDEVHNIVTVYGDQDYIITGNDKDNIRGVRDDKIMVALVMILSTHQLGRI